MHPILKNIITKGGKQYLLVSEKNWNNYLDVVSPNRNKGMICQLFYEKTDYNCELLYEKTNNFWCNNCNKTKEKWEFSCVNYINNQNLFKYADLLIDKNNKSDILTKKII
jgi:hypothetical protein